MPYPSYSDPDGEIADELDAESSSRRRSSTTPTASIGYVRRGGYRDEDDLAADIERYAR